MRNFFFILLICVGTARSANAEVIYLEERDLGMDLILPEAPHESEPQTYCDYTSTQFDPVTMDYKTVCLGLTDTKNGVADSFTDASSRWYFELSTWADSQDVGNSFQNVGVDLEAHYLEVYETAQRENDFNSKNWMLMQGSEIQQASVKEMLGKAFGGEDVRKLAADPTKDIKAIYENAVKMGDTGALREKLGISKAPSLDTPIPIKKR